MRFVTLALGLLALPVQADEASDAIAAAGVAYEAGDLGAAAEALKAASTGVAQQRSAALAVFLPATVDGWTVEEDPSFAEGMAMIGGGVGAMKRYTREDGTQISLSVMTGGEMIGAMAQMFSSPEMLAMMGKVIEVKGVSFVDQGNSVMALIGEKVLVQAEGAAADQVLPLLEQVDLEGIAGFGQ
jgi:hypothetical protein